MVSAKIQHYIKSGTRALLANFSVSFINIVGLSLGLAAVILIALFVQDELSYDRWLPDHARIHRIETTYAPPGRGLIKFAIATAAMKPLLDQDYPNLLEATTRHYRQNRNMSFDDKSFNETISYVDKEFFQVFDLETLAGNRDETLSEPYNLAISEDMASKYFGDANPIGKTLTMNEAQDYKVTAVFKNIPNNSHMRLDMVSLLDRNVMPNPVLLDIWTGVSMFLYVKTQPGIEPTDVEAVLGDFFDRHAVSNVPSLKKEDLVSITEMHVIPLPEAHFRTDRRAEMRPTGSKATVYGFTLIAGLILTIACINFMNLATARAGKRAREISMRKVLGASRQQLINQFLGETLFIILFAYVLALIFAQSALPYYNGFIAKDLSLAELFKLKGGFLQILLLALVTLGGGMYPAFYLSSFRPADTLTANQSSSDQSKGFRNVLVFVQFSISITLMISTMVVYAQTNYAKTMELGFTRDNMVLIGGLQNPQVGDSAETLKNAMKALDGVENAARSSMAPPIVGSPNTIVTMPGAAPTDAALVIEQIMGDFDYFDTYQMPLIAGRTFSEDYPADLLIVPDDEPVEGSDTPLKDATQSAIINESAMRLMGFSTPEEALGKVYYSNIQNNRRLVSTIIGVVPDAHYHTIHTDLVPMLFVVRDANMGVLTLRLSGNDIPATLSHIDQVWRDIVPAVPLNRTFLDEAYSAQYSGEAQRGQMFLYFALFAIFVACLGLYGLAAYNAERRTKEIGIHKVLGASNGQIVRMLVWQFTKPVLFANGVSWPVAYIIASDWLGTFAYRIDIDPTFFIGAGLATLIIAWGTVSNHAYRVAKTNPVRALRYE